MASTRDDLVWAALLATGLAFEMNALRHPERWTPLSSATRAVFRTDTRAGRVAFIAAWAALTAWFVPHILTTPPGG